MAEGLRLAAGLALAAATWIALRRLVGARFRRDVPASAILLDALPIAAGFALFLLATARPVVSGLGIAALGFGLGLADRVKRHVLREPVVFADRAELLEVVRHPRFYIAFVGTGRMIGGTLAIAALVALLFRIEPPLWPRSGAGAAVAVLLAAGIGRLLFVAPGRAAAALARNYGAWSPALDPIADARRFGLLATLIVHATTARAERPARQAAAQARAQVPLPAGQGPIVLWQAESFADAGRLEPALEALLPEWTRLKRASRLAGRLDVPAWGANTIRSELATIAGLDAAALGLDRFNPYERFVRVPLPTLATAARAAGYRTVCVHPYSRGFYERDKVMPLLGFDLFVGLEAFGEAATDAGYVTDGALADFVAGLIAREGPELFLFAISIENHGPWDARHDGATPVALPPSWAGYADAPALGRWLRHLAAGDAALGVVRRAVEAAGGGWLGVYGDHQPSLDGPFADPGTDYLLWRAGEAEGGATADIAASELAGRWRALMAAGGR